MSGWQLTGSLEKAGAGPGQGVVREESALNMFRSMDLKGRGGGSVDDTKLRTVHQNTINKIRAYNGGGSTGSVSQISSAGVDGRVVIWKL